MHSGATLGGPSMAGWMRNMKRTPKKGVLTKPVGDNVEQANQ